MRMIALVFASLSTLLTACATPTLFPSSVTSDMQLNPDFGVMVADPDVFRGSAVQLVGRIIDVQTSTNGTLIVAQQLSVQKYPAYGPVEASEPTTQFAVFYPGTIDPAGLWTGNKFMVAADMKESQMVNVDGAIKREPYAVARCMHVWKTGQYYDIADFPHSTDGYYPLEEQTYCRK